MRRVSVVACVLAVLCGSPVSVKGADSDCNLLDRQGGTDQHGKETVAALGVPHGASPHQYPGARQPPGQQDSIPFKEIHGLRWTATTAVPANVLAGIVLDTNQAMPLPEARLELRRNGTVVATTYSNRDGSFRLESPDTGAFELSVQMAFFEPVSEPVRIEGGRGIAAQIGLKPWPGTIEATAEPGLPTGTIRGVVRCIRRDEPLANVMLQFAGTTVGTVSDSQGRFSLVAPDTGRFVLVVRKIGYRNVSRTIELGPGAGLDLQVRLNWEWVDTRHWVDPAHALPIAAIKVRVRDALTRRAPETPVVVLRVAAGAVSDFAVSERAATGELADYGLLLHAGEAIPDQSPFEIEVFAPGYQVWRGISGRRVPPATAGGTPSIRHVYHVWLLPDGG